MLVIHIIAMVSTTIAAVVKAILLLLNRTETFRVVHAKTSLAIRLLILTGVSAAVYIIVTKFGGVVPPWLVIKICMFITGGLTVMIAEKKENKWLILIGALLLVMVIVQANIKINY